jgi:tetraprenyl-beta-curcumene synthase
MGNLYALARYWHRLLPQARRELAYWQSRAERIEDPELRAIALGKLAGEKTNIESAAFFALLAGKDWRRALRRIVAFQLAYELLDGLNEAHPALEDGLRLHECLVAGIMTADYDGPLGCAIQDVGEAQARNHAGEGLRAWAEAFAPRLLWWEAAAAGISSLRILAMLCSPIEHHEKVRGAYMEIDALAALLDALVDIPTDRLSGNHNWLDHYTDEQQAADRLGQLVDDADRAIRGLPSPGIHRMLLSGLLAHNLAPLGNHLPLVRLRLETRWLVRFGVRILRAIHGTVPTS